MATRTVFFAALAALPLAAAPAWAESEGNGPAGNNGAFTGWVVPVGAGAASPAGTNADGYMPRPCFGVAMTDAAFANGPGDGAGNAWPALPLGGSGAGTTHARASGPASGPGAPRG